MVSKKDALKTGAKMLAPGMIIEHGRFGKGTVKFIDGCDAEINFDDGQTRIIKTDSRLMKMTEHHKKNRPMHPDKKEYKPKVSAGSRSVVKSEIRDQLKEKTPEEISALCKIHSVDMKKYEHLKPGLKAMNLINVLSAKLTNEYFTKKEKGEI